MAVIPITSKGVKMLARVMRAEAVGDGALAELMVGNVCVNRVKANCYTFKNVRSIPEAIFQPHAFTSTRFSFFYQAARTKEINLARKAIKGERNYPASNSLWYFNPYGSCPAQWYGQWNVGKYKSFCYFAPTQDKCPRAYATT